MMKKPHLRPLAILPLMINILVYIGMIWLGIHYFQELIDYIDRYLPTWLYWLNWLLWGFFIISALILWLYTFFLIANLIASPFNGFLAERCLRQLGHEPSNSKWSISTQVIQSLAREGLILKYIIPRYLVLLLCFVIPGINLIAMPLWLVFSAWALTLEYLDYSADVLQISIKDLRKTMRKNAFSCLGFGSAVLLTSLIPGLNLLVIPTAVCGASLFFWAQLR